MEGPLLLEKAARAGFNRDRKFRGEAPAPADILVEE
jgi:hypothetical protein